MQLVGTVLSVHLQQSYTCRGPELLLVPLALLALVRAAASQREGDLAKLSRILVPVRSAPRTTTCATLVHIHKTI